MVVHNQEQTELWRQQKKTQKHREEKSNVIKKKKQSWSVIGVQSLACVVLFLMALLFRLIGGGAYEDLRLGFHRALEENELMTVVCRLLDMDPLLSSQSAEDSDVKQVGFTE